jgi:hypothetical protein
MITISGSVYGPESELGAAAQWPEGEKLVDFDWVRASGLEAKATVKAWTVSFARPDRVATLRLTGAEVIYELDAARQVRSRIVLRDGLTLIAQRSAAANNAAPGSAPFVAQASTFGPSQFWELMEPFGVLVDDANIWLRFNDDDGRLFLRLIPTTTIERIRTNQEAIELGRQLPLMTNRRRGAHLGRNKHGVFMCNFEPLEVDKRWGIVTNASQLLMTRELWGIDGWTISSKRLKEVAGVDFGYFAGAALETVFTNTLTSYLDFANRTLGIPLPLKFIAGAANVEGYQMTHPFTTPIEFYGRCLERNIVYEDEIRDYAESPFKILRPFFEKVWDQCGLMRPDVESLD